MVADGVVELAKRLQLAAVDPTQWQPALDAVNDFVHAKGAGLLTVEARRRITPTSTDAAEMLDDYFNRGWYLYDRREACLPLLRRNGIVCDHDFQSNDDIVNCDFYHDFLARHNKKWFAGVGVELNGDSWCLALQRSPACAPFGPHEMHRLQIVRHHLAEAAAISQYLGQSWMLGLEHALALMEHPAIVFDGRARVVFMNDKASAFFGKFLSEDRTIDFADRASATTLRSVLAGVLNPWEVDTLRSAGATLRVDERSFSCCATSLLDRRLLVASNAAALVVLKPLAVDLGANAVGASVMRKYRLTAAETKVFLALAAGQSVKEIASGNNIKENTVRAQLKSVYTKTNVNKQSKLVALFNKETFEAKSS